MTSLLKVETGRLTIRQSPQGQPTTRGLYFTRDGFSGWDDAPTMRGEATSRPQAHGDFDAPGYLAGRLMPIKGVCVASSPRDLEEQRDKFIGHGADGGYFTVTVTRNGRELHGTARLAAGTNPTFVDNGTGRRALWTASWWFPDPRKYGEPFDFAPGATVLAENRGNFPAHPRLRVTGSAPGGYTITGPGGRQIVISRGLFPGQPHVFDTADAALYVGGVQVLGGVTSADLFTLPPLSPVAVSVSGGLLLEVEGEATYV